MQLYPILCQQLATTTAEIKRYIASAPKKYKIYTIPKRTSGTRVIAQPSKMLKDYQRALVSVLESYFHVHETAYAYKKNTGIKQNAQQHLKSRYLLKMDFQDFFHSITPQLFFSVLKKLGHDIDVETEYLLTQTLFFNPSKKTDGKLILSIGAPSSPFISNVIMLGFDQVIDDICIKRNMTYTRYADDITFSTNEKNSLFDIPVLVRTLLLEHFAGAITVNESKTVFTSKAHNRHVTGITLTNSGQLSIGRQRKRMIASLIHQFTLGQLPEEEVSYLQGLLAFACEIEPAFKIRMNKKYTPQTVTQILKAVKVQHEQA
jgi:RNA-directed DNA polymerase